MLTNYFQIAFRHLAKNKGFATINSVGLASGMTAAILIMLWVKSEFSFDRFYSNTDQIYAVGMKDVWEGEAVEHYYTPKPMAAALKTDFPEINAITRVDKGTGFLVGLADAVQMPIKNGETRRKHCTYSYGPCALPQSSP